MKSSGYTSILAVAFEGSRMTVASLHRSNGGLQVRQMIAEDLPLDSLIKDPDRLGSAIHSCLNRAGIRERRCVVCIPLKWAYILHCEVPALSDKDVDGFLNVQAEREFPFAPEDLRLTAARYRTPDGAERATIVAVPLSYLAALQKALRVAKLRPLSITFAITSLLNSEELTEQGRVGLLVGEDNIDLVVSVGNAVVALRTLDEAVEVRPGEKVFDADLIARQIRITLGQFPPNLRDTIRKVSIFGSAERVGLLIDRLENLLNRMGLTVEAGTLALETLDTEPVVGKAVHPAALESAARRLLGGRPDFELLAPPSSRWSQLSGRVSSRATLWLAGAMAAIVLFLGAALLVQYWRVSRLQSEWEKIELRVGEAKILQNKVKQFRPWFNDSIQSLSIARKLTEAFPEEGTVWMRSLEIRNQSEVTCSGQARSNSEWLAMLDRLRDTKGVENLQVLQVRGESPLQFSISFQWNAGYADES